MPKPMTPIIFAKKMRDCWKSCSIAEGHLKADELMCKLLVDLGYKEGVIIFEKEDKYYA